MAKLKKFFLSFAQKHVRTAGVPRGSNSLFSQTAGVPRGYVFWTTGVPRGSKFFEVTFLLGHLVFTRLNVSDK